MSLYVYVLCWQWRIQDFWKGGGGAVHPSSGHAPPENFEFQAFWGRIWYILGRKLLSTIIIVTWTHRRSRSRASFRYTVRLYTRTHARARVLNSVGSWRHEYVYLVAGVGESPTGDARAFCATYFGGERLAPCRAGVVCTVTETTHTTSRKEYGGEEKGGGGNCPPAPPPPPRSATGWLSLKTSVVRKFQMLRLSLKAGVSSKSQYTSFFVLYHRSRNRNQ